GHDRGADRPPLLPPMVLARTDRRAVRQEDRQERDQQSTNHRRLPPGPGRFLQPLATICHTLHRSVAANERTSAGPGGGSGTSLGGRPGCAVVLGACVAGATVRRWP